MVASLRREVAVMREHPLDMVIFFVTGQCNSKCRHCFYWKNLGREHRGLSLEDIGRLTRSMPVFRTLLLSGGEPSLREDLPEIVRLFRENNGITSVGVPTNGLLPTRVAALASSIAALDPSLLVAVSVSVDGFSGIHDVIRGVPGGYAAAMETLQLLRQASGQHPNLRVHVNTVVSAENYGQLVEFANHIKSTALVDGHFFELIRGDPPEIRLKQLPVSELGPLYRKLLAVQESYIGAEARRRRGGLLGHLRSVVDLGSMVNKYRHQLTVYGRGRPWDFRCVAGRSIAVIDYDGGLRVCELRDRCVSLVESGMDFSAAWRSESMRAEAAIARSHACDCTHTCFLGIAMRQNYVARTIAAPWWYMRYRLGWLW